MKFVYACLVATFANTIVFTSSCFFYLWLMGDRADLFTNDFGTMVGFYAAMYYVVAFFLVMICMLPIYLSLKNSGKQTRLNYMLAGLGGSVVLALVGLFSGVPVEDVVNSQNGTTLSSLYKMKIAAACFVLILSTVTSSVFGLIMIRETKE